MMQKEGAIWFKSTIAAYGTPEEKTALREKRIDSIYARRLVEKYGGSVHKTPLYPGDIMMSSPYYPEKYTGELYDKGNLFSKALEETVVRHLDFFKQVKELKVSVYFFCGRYDYVTPTKPVEEYFKDLCAPYKEIVWFEESAHRMDIEEPDKFQDTIMRIAEKQN
jgi:pimeloyl-ACP methyl ester carboxylesterase